MEEAASIGLSGDCNGLGGVELVLFPTAARGHATLALLEGFLMVAAAAAHELLFATAVRGAHMVHRCFSAAALVRNGLFAILMLLDSTMTRGVVLGLMGDKLRHQSRINFIVVSTVLEKYIDRGQAIS